MDHDEEFRVAVQILSQDPGLQRMLPVQVQGEYRLICFCSMTQTKQTRVLEAQRRVHEAEHALRDFEESLPSFLLGVIGVPSPTTISLIYVEFA